MSLKKNIVLIIPSYESEKTIENVLSTIDVGLKKYYSDKNVLIIVVDSSNKRTQEKIKKITKRINTKSTLIFHKKKITKGKAIFKGLKFAYNANADVVVMLDSDLKSIRPEWVKGFIDPILKKKADFVGPKYIRDKYDSLITNHIAYPIVKTFLRANLRQPIGGDFSFSKKLLKFYLKRKYFIPEADRFGIDIWLSFSAIVNKCKITQICLGAKIHNATIKNPRKPEESLGEMFYEVISTLFNLLVTYDSFWTSNKYNTVREERDFFETIPKPVRADFKNLWGVFRRMYPKYKNLYRRYLDRELFFRVEELYCIERKHFDFDVSLWAKLLSNYICIYKSASRSSREKLLNSLIPLYFGRIACFVLEAKNMDGDQVEEKITRDLKFFKKEKERLKLIWVR